MKISKVKIGLVKPNPNNPRVIRDDKFQKLVNSIKEFPEMLELRPIIVNKDMEVLGGNMRLRACQQAGLKEVFIGDGSKLTPEQQKEFIIKDNVGFGEWDWDILANEWEVQKLDEWGLNVNLFSDVDKINELHNEIDNVGLPDFEIKDQTIRLIIKFETEDEREEFVKITKIDIKEKSTLVWNTWWPEKERDDLNSVKFQ